MSERVVEQIALGVSTRGYERSLEPVDESIETRGASKSNASRALIRRWVALGIAEAQKGFRRVKGYVHMPSLVAALRPTAGTVAPEKKVA